MKCSKCGTEFESRFCPNCGTPAFDLPAPTGKKTPTEQVPEATKLVTPKNKWTVLGGTVLFLLVVVVLITVLAQSCSSKKDSSGDKISQLADTTTSESNAAPAAAPKTPITSSLIGANSSQTASQPTGSQSTASQSQEYAEPTSSSDGETKTDNAIQSGFQDGMTYQEAKKIIGSDGVQESSVGNTVVYTWDGKGFGGSKLSLTFKDGKLDLSSSYGLD